jgi:hypothetical protein
LLAPAKLLIWGTTPCQLSEIKYIRSYFPHLEAGYIRNMRNRHGVVTRDPRDKCFHTEVTALLKITFYHRIVNVLYLLKLSSPRPFHLDYADNMRFQVLTATKMKVTPFWDVAPCSLVEID